MNVFDLFFVFCPAVQNLFHLGFLPNDDDFVELTDEERNSYFKEEQETGERIFRMNIPSSDERFNDMILCLTEPEKVTLMKAVKLIDKYGEGLNFANDEEKLLYVASRLPEVFSTGTKFERQNL